jgi:hypothetical protein
LPAATAHFAFLFTPGGRLRVGDARLNIDSMKTE